MTTDPLAALLEAAEAEADKSDPLVWVLDHADRLIEEIVDPWERAYAMRMRSRLATLPAPTDTARIEQLRKRLIRHHRDEHVTEPTCPSCRAALKETER
jgi:hypothetical protein